MLTICTQLREMNLKKLIVATKSGTLGTAMKSLNLWQNQNYVDREGQPLIYHVVLRNIHDIIHTQELDIIIKDPGKNEAIQAIYDTLHPIAVKATKDKMMSVSGT